MVVRIVYSTAIKKAEKEYEMFWVKQYKSIFRSWFIREVYKNGINFKSTLWGKR